MHLLVSRCLRVLFMEFTRTRSEMSVHSKVELEFGNDGF